MGKPSAITRATWEEARRLQGQGVGVRDIGDHLGLGKSTVARLLAGEPPVDPPPPPPLKPGERPPEKLPPVPAAAKAAAREKKLEARVLEAAARVAPILHAAPGASPDPAAPPPPVPVLPEGAVPTDRDHDLRILHVAELLKTEGWRGVTTLRELMAAWKCSLPEVERYARDARKRLRREFGIDSRARMLVLAVSALARIAGKAEAAGAYSAAVQAHKAILSTAPLDASGFGQGRNLSAEGLPPELAKLKNPGASPQEVAHFAEVDEAACTYTGCRVHPRAEAVQGAVPPVPVVTAASSGPMH